MTDGLKSSLTDTRAAIVGILACITLLSIAACTTTGSSAQVEASSVPANVETAKDLSFFDSIVTPEAVFPDPIVRALYRESPTTIISKEQRIYQFNLYGLYESPEMDPARDAHDIDVLVWVPSKKVSVKKNHYDYSKDIPGRIEEYSKFETPTPDGLYAIRITSNVWLPKADNVPKFDPESTAKRLLLNYSQDSNQTKLQALPAPSASEETEKDFFDSIVTPEIVFPDPAVRALYEGLPPVTLDNGWRGYTFMLIRQSAMKKRHFCIITVLWAPAGTFPQGSKGTGGPGGGFVNFSTQTSDGKYDLRISLADRLPVAANAPVFDLDSTAKRLLLRYSQNLNNQTIKR
jgi:hypothetical protein